MKLSRLLLFALLLSASSLFAQEGGTLTFEEAITIGLQNNVQIKQNQNTLTATEVQRTSSYMNLLPSVSARGTAARRTGNTFNQQEGVLITGTIDFVSASMNANVPLFNGLQNYNQIKSDNYQYMADKAQLEFSRQNTMVNISTQYLNVLVNRELLDIARENLQFQQTSLNQVKVEVELGRTAKVDEYNQISNVKSAELDVFRAVYNLRNSKATLAQTLQLDPTQEFEVVRPDFTVQEPDISLEDTEQLSNIALENRQDYAASENREQSNLFQQRVVFSNALPSLSLFGSVGSQYNRVIGNPNTRSFSDQFGQDNRFFQYGLSLNVPIFNNLNTRTNYVRQQVNYENAKLSRVELANNIRNDVQQAALNYRDAMVNYEMALAQMEAREKSQALNTESYELGLLSLLDYSQSNRDYYNARSDLARAELNLLFQKIIIQATMGMLEMEEVVGGE